MKMIEAVLQEEKESGKCVYCFFRDLDRTTILYSEAALKISKRLTGEDYSKDQAIDLVLDVMSKYGITEEQIEFEYQPEPDSFF